MDNRKQAMTELLAKVEAGKATMVDIHAVLQRDGLNATSAYNGSLDAAKALHDAVLGVGWNYSIHNNTAYVMTWAHTVEGKVFSAANSNPARAWLIAIIKALIAEADA